MSILRGAMGALAAARGVSRLGAPPQLAGPLLVPVRTHWNKDFKPGPYPQTPEERKAAAEKYNLPVEWYDVYPNDGTGFGDYPKLPMISAEARDDFYPWDYPEFKRNFDEPIHVDEEIINDTRYNVNYRHLVPVWKQVAMLAGVISFFVGLHFYYRDYDRKICPPTTPKQYPKEGVHYTFEPLHK